MMLPWEGFFDPVLRAPLLGAMLMGMTSALVGVLVFVRKRTLLGEALSHATYPGVTIALLLGGSCFCEGGIACSILLGAALAAWIGLCGMNYMEKKLKLSSDAVLAFVLVFFFSIGITLASYIQQQQPKLCRYLSTYLYGQVATMTDFSLLVYGVLALSVVGVLLLFYKELVLVAFDPLFAKASGRSFRTMDFCSTLLIVLAVIIGIRSVGVILMSAMLVAPAVAARQFTNRLASMLVLSGILGVFSSWLGTYLSLCFPRLPTGPLIVLVAGGCALYGLLFAPQRGVLIRWLRMVAFRMDQARENHLKALWHKSQKEQRLALSDPPFRGYGARWKQRWWLRTLVRRGYLSREGEHLQLTALGLHRGEVLVRLHRLWEVYLVHAIGLGVERVHASAEEMEHILTPELERRLTALLDDPQYDPHDQPIPPYNRVSYDG